MNYPFFIAKRLAFNKNRSFTKVIIYIAIAGIALSIATMILSTAIINGFKSEINSKIFGFWGNIHVYDGSVMRNFELKPFEVKDSLLKAIEAVGPTKHHDDGEAIGISLSKENTKFAQGGVKSAHPYIIMPCLIETKKELLAALYKGVDDKFDWTSMQKYLIKGNRIDSSDSTQQVVISKIIADKLSIDVDNKIIITFIKDKNKIKRALVVKAIYKTGLEEYDNRFIIGKAKLLQDIMGWGDTTFSGIEISVDDAEEMTAINDYLYADVLPANLYSETIKEKFPSIFDWLKLQDINELVILQLMAIVAIINLITVLLILILERTPMIGTLKALGATNMKIRQVFLYNIAYILLFGLLIGNALGLGIAYLQHRFKFISLDERSYYLDFAPIKIEIWEVLMINFGCFVLCMIILIIPSYLISRMSPVKALKFN